MSGTNSLSINNVLNILSIPRNDSLSCINDKKSFLNVLQHRLYIRRIASFLEEYKFSIIVSSKTP